MEIETCERTERREGWSTGEARASGTVMPPCGSEGAVNEGPRGDQRETSTGAVRTRLGDEAAMCGDVGADDGPVLDDSCGRWGPRGEFCGLVYGLALTCESACGNGGMGGGDSVACLVAAPNAPEMPLPPLSER